MKIGFLGLGAMGSRMAAKLIEDGHEVTVWNRSKGAETPEGASRAATPAETVSDAELAISMVRDDDASHSVWLGENGALAALSDRAIGIECSTLSLPFVQTLSAEFKAARHAFVDAPLAGSRPQAEAGALIFFVGGGEEDFARVEPILKAMGGVVHHAGSNSAGTSVKLMVNTLFGAQLAVLGELMGFAEKSGHNVDRLFEILTSTPVVSPAAQASVGAMSNRAFDPAFPIDLVHKDFELVCLSGKIIGANLPLAEACKDIYGSAISEGYGADNITGIAQRYVS